MPFEALSDMPALHPTMPFTANGLQVASLRNSPPASASAPSGPQGKIHSSQQQQQNHSHTPVRGTSMPNPTQHGQQAGNDHLSASIALSGSSSQGTGCGAQGASAQSQASGGAVAGGSLPLWRRPTVDQHASGTMRSTGSNEGQQQSQLGGQQQSHLLQHQSGQGQGNASAPPRSLIARGTGAVSTVAPAGAWGTAVPGQLGQPQTTTGIGQGGIASGRGSGIVQQTPAAYVQMQMGLGGGPLMMQANAPARNSVGPSPQRARGAMSTSPVRSNGTVGTSTMPTQAAPQQLQQPNPEWMHGAAQRAGRIASPRREVVTRDTRGPAFPRSISPTPPSMGPAAVAAAAEASAVAGGYPPVLGALRRC